MNIITCNYTNGQRQDIINHPCPNFKGGLAKLPLSQGMDELEHPV